MDLENEKHFINSLKDDELHTAFKFKMKEIILFAIEEFTLLMQKNRRAPSLEELDDFINNFVEERFKPE